MDAEDANENPAHAQKKEMTVTNKDQISIKMLKATVLQVSLKNYKTGSDLYALLFKTSVCRIIYYTNIQKFLIANFHHDRN